MVEVWVGLDAYDACRTRVDTRRPQGDQRLRGARGSGEDNRVLGLLEHLGCFLTPAQGLNQNAQKAFPPIEDIGPSHFSRHKPPLHLASGDGGE